MHLPYSTESTVNQWTHSLIRFLAEVQGRSHKAHPSGRTSPTICSIHISFENPTPGYRSIFHQQTQRSSIGTLTRYTGTE